MSLLGPGREFDRIRAMAARWKDRARGLGDDCAFIESGGERLAVSIDLSIEDVHFRRAWLTPGEIGYRAAAAAFSDLAAVAAAPMALLLSLGVPDELSDETLFAIADGVGDAAGDAGALVVGGDLSRSEKLVVDCCVIGRAGAEVRRRVAKPGDRLVVTGALAMNGLLSPLAALAAAWLASTLADGSWFAAGRRYGGRVMRFLCRVSLSPDSCVRQSETRFSRWGSFTLLFAKFIPGLSQVAPPLADSARRLGCV